jgi:hypothetical protein
MRAPAGTLLRAGLALVLGLALVSCTDDPKPGTVGTPTPTPTSSSASPTPSTPEAQIEATMRAYFETTNTAFGTGDVAALRAFSSDGCPCRKAADDIERVVDGGGRFEGLRYDVRSIRVHDVEADTGLAEVIARVPPYKVYDGSDTVTENSKGGRLHTDFSLVRSGDRWIIGNSINL